MTTIELITDNLINEQQEGQRLEFKMSDISKKQKYDVDILMFSFSDLYKATEIREDGYYVYE